jgi:DNA repair exonuclease SbcCD ATPase subunit
MIEFPILEELVISGYGLFPGMTDSGGLRVTFRPGLTLILGANGLGKTTLITIWY